MWPLMLRTLALNLRAGIPLQEAVHANPGSGQLGESEPVSGAQKMPAKKTTAKKSLRVRRTRGSSPLSDDYGQKRCAEDIRRFTQALATVTSWGAPRTSPAPSCSKTAPGCARTATSACTTCS